MRRPVLLFDVMGTLVTEPFLTAMPQFFDMPLERLRGEVHPTAWIEFEKGNLTEQQFCEQFFRDGRTVDLSGLRACLFDAYQWIDGMQELLDELNSRGFSIHALSNYPVWYELIEEKLGLSSYLNWTFVSCKTGFRKPEPHAYHLAAKQLQLAAGECLFIDDRPENVDAANAVGMDGILIQDANGVRGHLVQRKILVD